MRSFKFIITLILISIFFASLFGILHDQVTYTISPEYFSKFKFQQFGIGEAVPYRLGALVIGFSATWWTGIFIGLVIGTMILVLKITETRKAIRNTLFLIFGITVSMAFLGYLFGKMFIAKNSVRWFLPEDLIDREAFVIVGSIHNFSYLGGFIGLLAAVFYLFKLKKREKLNLAKL